MASNPYYRIGLYTLLKTYGKEKLYPAKYLSQEKFAEGAPHQSMSEDDIPDRLKLGEYDRCGIKDKSKTSTSIQYQFRWRRYLANSIQRSVPVESQVCHRARRLYICDVHGIRDGPGYGLGHRGSYGGRGRVVEITRSLDVRRGMSVSMFPAKLCVGTIPLARLDGDR